MKAIVTKLTILLATLAALANAQGRVPIKNVAVIETQVDEHSGAATELNMAELREITAVLRREAVRALPKERYNIMTSETVLAMGEAVLEECAEENCVIALGSKIGADYIVRGTVSKFRTMFSLTVELYETDYGNLIAVAEAVRSANLDELLEKSSSASAAMYADFMKKSGVSAMAQEVNTVAVPKTVVVTVERGRQFSIAARYMIPGPKMTPKYGGLMLEFAWSRVNGSYWGFDLGFGLHIDETGRDVSYNYPNLSESHNYSDAFAGGLVGGVTANRGWAYDFGETKLEYGLSLGFWPMTNGDHRYSDSNIGEVHTRLGFGGPFIKLRWRYLEVSYRAMMGWGFDRNYYSDYYNEDSGFRYNTQLTAGFRFGLGGKKRVK
jgi:hypothetical protein